MDKKKSWVAILILDKIDFKTKSIKRDTDGYFIIMKGRICQKDINVVNIYSPNLGAPKYIKKILEDFKRDIDNNTLIVGDFNTPLSKRDRSSKQNINKDIVALNDDALHQMDLIYTEPFILKKQNTHFLKSSLNIFKDRPHDRTQSKPHQIQENGTHIKHFL